jgi:uncharacterized membrane protein
MGIGVSVFLLAIGAVLGFAVDYTVQGVDVHLIGFILMAAGILGLFVTTLVFGGNRRSGVVTEERVVDRSAY